MQHPAQCLAQSKCSVSASFTKPIRWPEMRQCGVSGRKEPDCSSRGEIIQRTGFTDNLIAVGESRALSLCHWLWVSHCPSLTLFSSSEK